MMAFDLARRQTVLFGGLNDGGLLGDTWTWDGTTWMQENPDASPRARDQSGFAYDKARQEVVLFGGYGPGPPRPDFVVGQTWTWNGTTWTQKHPDISPPDRGASGMAYDAATHQVVLFGGEGHGVSTLGDTWTWDGTTWTHQALSCG
jgi:hypothetical protein